MEEKVKQLQAQLQASQSRSFEIISQISADRDQANGTVNNLQKVIAQIATVVGLEQPTIAELVNHIQLLQASSSKKPKGGTKK